MKREKLVRSLRDILVELVEQQRESIVKADTALDTVVPVGNSQ